MVTHTMFIVRVPVLSLHIVVAEPIVSHADKCLTWIKITHQTIVNKTFEMLPKNYIILYYIIFIS